MKLYFARHGQTDMNANGVSNNSTDEPLNAVGVGQATELAQDLSNVAFDAIISSPLRRALQTTELVNEYHHLPIKKDAAWQERYARSHMDLQFWNDIFDFDKDIQLEDGEGLTEFFERIYVTIDALKKEYADKTVLVVSHGGVQHALYAYANHLPWSGNMRIKPTKNCEVRIYEL